MHRESSRAPAAWARGRMAALLLCFLCPAAALGQDRLAGTWQGSWSRAGDALPVTMIVQRDPAGAHGHLRLRPPARHVIPSAGARRGLLRGDAGAAGRPDHHEFQGRVEGDSLTGVFRRVGRGTVRVPPERAGAVAFEEREITFRSGDATLAGRSPPPGAGPSPRSSSCTALVRRGAGLALLARRSPRAASPRSFRQARRGGVHGRLGRPARRPGGRCVAAVARLREEPRIDRRDRHPRPQPGRHAGADGRGALVPWRSSSLGGGGLPTDSVDSTASSTPCSLCHDGRTRRRPAYASALVAAAYRGEPRGAADSLACC